MSPEPGYLRLSPGYLPAIYRLSRGHLPEIHTFFPLLSSVFLPPQVDLACVADFFAHIKMADSEETQDAMVTQTEPEPSLCLKCGMPVSEDDGKFKGAGITCSACQNVYQMLYRHLGGYPSTLQTMSPDDQQKFFRTSNPVLRSAPKNGRWSVLRANLITEMTRFKVEQVTRTVEQKFLPLGVWQTQGFDTDKIMAKGERRDCEVPCQHIFDM